MGCHVFQTTNFTALGNQVSCCTVPGKRFLLIPSMRNHDIDDIDTVDTILRTVSENTFFNKKNHMSHSLLNFTDLT